MPGSSSTNKNRTTYDRREPLGLVNLEPAAADYRKFTMVLVEALNHALKGLAARPHPLSSVLGKLARPA